MAADETHRLALVALNRFGLGARGGAAGDFLAASSDPRGFVKAELNMPRIALLESPGLASTKDILSRFYQASEETKRLRELATPNPPPPLMPPGNAPTPPLPMAQPVAPPAPVAAPVAKPASGFVTLSPPIKPLLPATPTAPLAAPAPKIMAAAPPVAGAAMMSEARNPNPSPRLEPDPQALFVRQTFQNESLARIQRAHVAHSGFVERLVAFWSNHFCISIHKGGPVRVSAGAFEREAIRPHVLGRFADMLKAVEQHPAMLLFLDNNQSIGPNSKAGQNRKRGLNENLAREILELHTLGVNGGYTQDDVTALARIITGWTFVGPQAKQGQPGTFLFNPNMHEPGAQNVLGKTYADEGLRQGEATLDDLARHPSTATFIATKLARHFVADVPPPSLIEKLAKVFRSTDGDLKAVVLALVDANESWAAPLTKLRSPWDYLIATARIFPNPPEQPYPILNWLNQTGQPLWSPAGPNGFADTAAAWATPEGMKVRLEIASAIGKRLGERVDPQDLLAMIGGAAVSMETKQAVARAESRAQGLAMVFMSPEFQRR